MTVQRRISFCVLSDRMTNPSSSTSRGEFYMNPSTKKRQQVDRRGGQTPVCFVKITADLLGLFGFWSSALRCVLFRNVVALTMFTSYFHSRPLDGPDTHSNPKLSHTEHGGLQGDSPAPPTPPSPCKYKTTHKWAQINISYNRDFAKVCFGFPGVSLRRVRLLVPLAQTGNSESFCSSLFPSFRCQSCDVVLKPNQSCRKQATTASSCCSFDSHPPSRPYLACLCPCPSALQISGSGFQCRCFQRSV